MATTWDNAIDVGEDIAGSLIQLSNKTLTDETAFFGQAVAGQSGAAAAMGAAAGGSITLTGLTGMAAASQGRFITIGGAATGVNNDTFYIHNFISPTSVAVIDNGLALGSDANNGALTWTERAQYSLEDDLNFIRTDRAAIKGSSFSAGIPTYDRPSAVGTLIPASLANLAGRTLDAKALVINRKFENQAVGVGDLVITLSAAGLLKHADAVDRTGVPINDGSDIGDLTACNVTLVNAVDGTDITVLGGGNVGQRVFGISQAGGGVSPNAVEVKFYSVPVGSPNSTVNPYTWEAGQTTSLDLFYGFREQLDNLNENALRVVLANGIIGDAGIRTALNNSQDILDLGVTDSMTHLATLLTNANLQFPFTNLPDATPSVVEALNTLNSELGNRTFTGGTLTSGQTVAASLQALSNALGQSSATRIIERLTAEVPKFQPHTLPAGNTYTIDGTNNGQNLWVFWRGKLRDPGTALAKDSYGETSSTTITPYSKIKKKDRINYIIFA